MIQFKAHSGLLLDAIAFGVYLIPPGEKTYRAVTSALELGYRSFDTAKYYENEADVAKAIKDSGIKNVHVTTKVWNDEQGYQKAINAANRSRDYLQVDSIDLLLVHWPGKGKAKMLDTWRAFEELQQAGVVKHIGVSNFNIIHLELIEKEGMTKPAVNQIELNPLLTQEKLRQYCQKNGIIVEAWCPLVKGHLEKLAEIEPIAKKYKKTLAQISLRWSISNGVRVLAKSEKVERMKENFDIFDFELTNEEIKKINDLNINFRQGPDPLEFIF